MNDPAWRFLGDFHLDTPQLPAELVRYAEAQRLPTILNLEGAFAGGESARKQFVLTLSESCLAQALSLLEVRAVCLANNHATDHGPEGLARLLSWLDALGIGHFGAGMNLQESLRPWTTEIGGKTTHFVAFGWAGEACVPSTRRRAGVAPLEAGLVLETVRSLVNTGRVVVVLHWGYEFETLPLPVDRRLARDLAEAGTWLVVGHHSHAIQSFESFGDVPVFYGLGNFFFGTRREPMHARYPHTGTGLEVLVDWDTRSCRVRELDGMTLCDTGTSAQVHALPPLSEAKYLEKYKQERRVRYRPVLLPGRPLLNKLSLECNRSGLSAYYKVERTLVQLLKRIGIRRRR